MQSQLEKLAEEAGACAIGFTEAEPVEAEQNARFDRWLSLGLHGELSYMANHADIRRNPRLLLPGARSIISLAFPYSQPSLSFPLASSPSAPPLAASRAPFPLASSPSTPPLASPRASFPLEPSPSQDCAEGASPKVLSGQLKIQNSKFKISSYALGEDYHIALRRRLQPVVDYLQSKGFEARICIDSAPIHERYFAVKAGLGSIGRNGSLIIPGLGSKFFLAEILTTAPLLTPQSPIPGEAICLGCTRCVDACPTGAITSEGIDARRCLSALTIEHRGDFTEQQKELLREKGRGALFGCDICRDVCPHNQAIKQAIQIDTLPEFRPSEAVRTLTEESIRTMTGGEFKRRFSGSPLFRAGIKGLRRNLDALITTE